MSSILKKMNFFFFGYFYVELSLNANNCVCRLDGVTCGQYKDKEEKTSQKDPKNVKGEHFEGKKHNVSFLHSPTEHILKILGSWVENCDL